MFKFQNIFQLIYILLHNNIIFSDLLGLKIINVSADHELPDCVFVEDPLIIIENKALFTTLGHPSRRPEVCILY